MCRFRGCVSFATHGETCAIHASGLGAHCPVCAGTGTTWRRDSGKADVCDRCGGTGLIDHRKGSPRRVKVPVAQRALMRLMGDE